MKVNCCFNPDSRKWCWSMQGWYWCHHQLTSVCNYSNTEWVTFIIIIFFNNYKKNIFLFCSIRFILNGGSDCNHFRVVVICDWSKHGSRLNSSDEVQRWRENVFIESSFSAQTFVLVWLLGVRGLRHRPVPLHVSAGSLKWWVAELTRSCFRSRNNNNDRAAERRRYLMIMVSSLTVDFISSHCDVFHL